MKRLTQLFVVALTMFAVGVAHAVTIELVPVGNPGNAPDTRYTLPGYGSVSDPYLIGKYEVSNAQYREFLAAKARTSDPYGLFNTNMGIARTWNVDHFEYTAKGGDANWNNRPVNWVSFWDAARFVNWLHNGQGNGDTETGAYINIGDQNTFARQAGARYFIPTENQWYKAAYFDPNKGGVGVPGYWEYPMRSDRPTVPSNDLTNPDGGNNANFYQDGYTIGSPYCTTVVGDFENSASAYGTFDQGGNVWEWNETRVVGSTRGERGGGWNGDYHALSANYRNDNYPSYEIDDIGFRVASVPEPSTIVLLGMGAIGLLGFAWRRRKRAAASTSRTLALILVASIGGVVHADVFNMGGTRNPDGTWSGLASIEFVPVGNPGNTGERSRFVYGDTTYYGGVAYPYLIGKYEVTNAQWREFLSVKAAVGDPYGLYNTDMAGTYGGIARRGSGTAGDPWVYYARGYDPNWNNRPVNYVSFWDAARFCNWLQNGQGNGDTETGAYINIGNQATFARQPGAKYFIPTENEWYKAAYHKNDGVTANYWDFPTGSDTKPKSEAPTGTDLVNGSANYYEGAYVVGAPYYTTTVGAYTAKPSKSPYGTFDQAGNLWEWNETFNGSSPGLRGGSWWDDSPALRASSRYGEVYPSRDYNLVGFRVASIPEPGSITLLLCGAVGLLGYAWRRRKRATA